MDATVKGRRMTDAESIGMMFADLPDIPEGFIHEITRKNKCVKIDWYYGRKSYRKARWKRRAWRGVKQILKELPDTKSVTVII